MGKKVGLDEVDVGEEELQAPSLEILKLADQDLIVGDNTNSAFSRDLLYKLQFRHQSISALRVSSKTLEYVGQNEGSAK